MGAVEILRPNRMTESNHCRGLEDESFPEPLTRLFLITRWTSGSEGVNERTLHE